MTKGLTEGKLIQEWTFKEALEFVSAARPQASPNAGFMARLLELDQKLHGKRTVKVRHMVEILAQQNGFDRAWSEISCGRTWVAIA